MKLLIILKQFFKEYQTPILSGVLIGTSYIPLPPWASLFGFVPLWIYFFKNLENNTLTFKKVFFAAWVTQYILTLIGFNWIAFTIHEFGGLPWIIGLAGLLVHCAYANIYIPIACTFWYWLHRKCHWKQLHSLLALSLATLFGEYFLQFIFQWNFGYPWYWMKFPVFHLAEYIGFWGLSQLVILSNAFLAYAWINRKQKVAKTIVATIVSVFVLLNGLGVLIKRGVEKPDALIRPQIVQANIPNQQKIYAEQGWGFRTEIVRRFIDLTLEHKSEKHPPDFSIWPETAFPDYMNHGTPNVRRLKRFIRDNKIRLVTGSYAKHENNQSSNSIFFFGPDGFEEKPQYIKTNLLAFGEYVPLREIIPSIKKLFPMVADFKSGSGPKVVEYAGVKLGAQICYEALYPEFSRELANQNAEVIVNVTNDSWFGTWQEPYQHLYMTLARAVEYRRPLVRSTNTGISTVVLASGEILEKSPINEKWQKTYSVPYKKNPKATFYQSFPYLFPLILALLFIYLTVTALLRRNKTND